MSAAKKTQKSGAGWVIPLCKGNPGRNLIVPSQADEVIGPVNALGRLEVVYDEVITEPQVIFSDAKVIVLLPRPSATSGSAVGAITRAIITANVFGDYVEATLWDDDAAAFTGEVVNVARPPELRCSVTADTIYSIGVTYANVDDNTRTAASAGYDTETHKIIPPYEENRVIYITDTGAATGVTADSADVTWIDLNIGCRYWSAIPSVPIP